MTPQFATALTDVKKLVEGRVRQQLEYYRGRVDHRRIAYRVSGAIVIVLGASIPLLVHIPDAYCQAWVVGIVGVVVAITSSLGQFFQWQKVWHDYSMSIFLLEDALTQFDLRVKELSLLALTDDAKATADLLEDGRALLRTTGAVIQSEIGQFFTRLESAQSSKAPKPGAPEVTGSTHV